MLEAITFFYKFCRINNDFSKEARSMNIVFFVT